MRRNSWDYGHIGRWPLGALRTTVAAAAMLLLAAATASQAFAQAGPAPIRVNAAALGPVVPGEPYGPRISGSLAVLYRQYTTAQANGALNAAAAATQQFAANHHLSVVGGNVLVEAVTGGNAGTLVNNLNALGAQVTGTYRNHVSAYVPIAAIGQLANLNSVAFATTSLGYRTNVGQVTTQGDIAMHTDQVRTTSKVDGSGQMVGVLSDSYNALGTAAAGVASGDLPANVQVLADAATGTDEGRGMLEIVHDVAPGASLAFATGNGGDAAMAARIVGLKNLGCTVIVDDLSYLDEPFFQDGTITQATDQVAAGGVPYFSSSSNNGRQSYQDAFRDSGQQMAFNTGTSTLTETMHNFNPGAGTNVLQPVNIPLFASVSFILQWSNPFKSVSPGSTGATTDLDMFLMDSAGTTLVAGSAFSTIGGDPLEIVQFVNLGPGTSYNIAIGKLSGPNPAVIKYIAFDDGFGTVATRFATNSSCSFGHPNGANAAGVGAAFYQQTPAFGTNPPVLEPYSSAGGTPILFDIAGNAIGSIVRQKPNITGPDGVDTSFFPSGAGNDADGDGFPNFFGTSAAAPHAAALAALMLQVTPGLAPAGIYGAMQATAIDMGPPGFDFDSGYGFLNGPAAVQFITDSVPPTIQIVSPANGSLVNQIAISGIASDTTNTGAPGIISRVVVALQRNSDGAFWNGASWGARALLPATVNPDGTWQVNTVALPTGVNLTSGGYTVRATAFDAGNNSASDISVFTVDATAPTVTVTTPVNNTVVQSITAIAGTAADNAGGSGLQSVVAVLERASDSTFWNGLTWTTTVTTLPTVLNPNGTWTLRGDVVLPSGFLLDSIYLIGATATDNAGNVGSAVNRVIVTSGLGITFTTPLNGGAIPDFSNITGRAVESPLASGLAQVTVTIQRKSDGAFWNGNGWGTSPIGLATTLNADGTWAIRPDAGFPVGANAVSGDYVLTAIVRDRGGNTASATVTVTLDSVPPTVTIATPADQTIVRSFPRLAGTATDNPGGSGIGEVRVSIIRFDGVSWNGTFWAEAPSYILAQLSSTAWSIDLLNAQLPQGADLVDGKYTIQVTAVDKAGGATTVSRSVIVDNTPPNAATITAPRVRAVLRVFSTIAGRSSDNAGGSGVGSVSLYIQRQSDARWWNGAAWSTVKTPLSTLLSTNGFAWSRGNSLPVGTTLQDDGYTLSTTTTDKAGNKTDGSTVSFTVDRSAPTVTFLAPAASAIIKSLPVVQGTVDDNINGSGVKSVTLTIQRRSDAKYWNGAAWTSRPTALTTTISGDVWTRRAPLPRGTDLSDGQYILVAQATDVIGNSAPQMNIVTVDTTAPNQVTFVTPPKDAHINAFTTLVGTAADRGSGIDHVELTLQRHSDRKFWTGRAWSATRTLLTNRLTGSTWRATVALPTGTNAVAGTYILTATAFDKGGNALSVTSTVTVGEPAGTPSAVRLSTATASVAQDNVQLRFSGALASDAASDAAHYTLTVNGRAVVVESAGYNATTHTVTLGLPEAALHAGNSVVVHWHGLLDTQGGTLDGQIGPLTAR